MRAPVGALVVVAWALAACSGPPDLQDVEPAMTAAVHAVAGPEADVRREVQPRCGPADEVLDGMRVRLRADVPPGSTDLDGVAAALRRADLDVEVGDGTDAALLAITSGDGWTADLWPGDDGTWWLTATAEVDGDPGTVGGPVTPCG